MNLIGKILVVMICVVSIFSMAGAMSVYFAHKDWKASTQSLQTKVDTAKSENVRLKKALQNTEQRFEETLDSHRARIASAETQVEATREQAAELQKQLEESQLTQRSAIAATEATQQNNSDLIAQNAKLQEEIRIDRTDRDNIFLLAQKSLDDFQQKVVELQRATEVNNMLNVVSTRYRAIIKAASLNPDTPADAIVPMIQGVITQVRRKGATTRFELSIGSDDGLKVGNTVEVYRGNRYLGRADILSTSPNRSVGKMIPQFRKGPIQENDRVATKLRVR